MNNRITAVTVRNHSLAPCSAEAWITLTPHQSDARTDIRGRLSGPRNAYSTTVEVAYPLQPLGPSAVIEQPPTAWTRRVVVPEPSFWDTKSPFLYEGPVELWQDGVCCDRVLVRHGFRALGLSRTGLHINGHPLTLRGSRLAHLDADGIGRLRAQGLNLAVLSTGDAGASSWEAADRLGMHVLMELPLTAKDALARAEDLASHPCALGFLIPTDADWSNRLPRGLLIGTQLERPPTNALPAGIHFVCGGVDLAAMSWPLLVRGPAAATSIGVPVLGVLQE